MKKYLKFLSLPLIAATLLTSGITAYADEERINQADIAGSVDPTQWVAVDGLGRELTTYEQAGDKKERTVGMFYWTWHNQLCTPQTPTNLTEFIKENPDAKNDYNHEAWKGHNGAFFWDEPIYGYYNGIDNYVLRKQAELLADAGVDFVVFDCTNGSFTWDNAYMRLLKVWEEAKLDGVDVPQITFMLNFAPFESTRESVTKIYKKLYSKEKYKDLWFYWDDKPLMIGYPEILKTSDPDQKEILQFFTWKRNVASYFEGDKKPIYWGWLHTYPQALYKENRGTQPEMTTVGVAINADYVNNKTTAMNGENIMGRSYAKDNYSYSFTYKGETVTVDDKIENSSMYGRHFQQQWDYAIEKDPELVFVTGWNEWTAGRYEEWGGVSNAFPDQFTEEYSRDIEPTKGSLKDHYYNQLVSNIRKYKGMSPTAFYKSNKTIDINGDVAQWDFETVATFNHYINSTYDRNTVGYGKIRYENDTMRNDIVQTRVAYDAANVYFYVRTLNDLTPSTDPAWMRLFIDTEKATAEGKSWEEYEYVINRTSPGEKATLERSKGGWDWEKVADVDYSVKGNVLQISVPRTALGLTESLDFNFKWSDNMQTDGDIMDFYTNGDVAPGARYMFDFNVAQADVPVISDISSDTTDAGSDTVTEPADLKTGLIIGIIAAVVVAGGAVGAVVVLKKKKK